MTKIGKEAFSFCDRLSRINIPDSVSEIGDRAFYNCEHLSSIHIPANLTKIGENAFVNCKRLGEMTVESSNQHFTNNNGVVYSRDMQKFIYYPKYNEQTAFTIPDSVTVIGADAFACCRNLQSVTIPESVTEIGTGAFEECTNLQSVTIPDSVKTVGSYAFHNCNNLRSVTVLGRETEIGRDAFVGCENLRTTNIPDRVMKIGRDVFKGCTKIDDHICADHIDRACSCKICGTYVHDFEETREETCNRFQCIHSWFNCGQEECPPDVGKIITIKKKCKRCGYKTQEEYMY